MKLQNIVTFVLTINRPPSQKRQLPQVSVTQAHKCGMANRRSIKITSRCDKGWQASILGSEIETHIHKHRLPAQRIENVNHSFMKHETSEITEVSHA
jgi:hypothetical protein